MTDRYAVIGNPIAHSKSPRIHSVFAAQTGQNLEYGKILGTPGQFAEEVQRFFISGGKGLNVTVPFKLEAWKLADELSAAADMAQAVNTLIPLEDGRLRGDNTDGVGLVRDLSVNHGAQLEGMQILLLGAGGATRGVLGPLMACNPASIIIANRTSSRAVDLAAAMGQPTRIQGLGLDQLAGRKFDLVINATAAGLEDKVPAIPNGLLSPNGWCYDMMYGDRPTAFVRWGQRQGAFKSLDGLGMLVEQAAESFYLWRAVRPDTAPVIRALRAG